MLKLIAGFLHQRVSAEKNTYWSELIGNPDRFSLERRIFHAICIGLVAVAVIYVPYNLYARLYVGSLSALILSLIFFFQYYYSRFHNIEHSNILFGLTGILIFAINYFTNSGIHGSTDLVWPAYLLLVFAITPYRQHVRWLILYLLAFLIVHVMEYKFPNLIQYPFNIGKGQFTDRITAFPVTVLAIYIIIKYLRRSYDNERARTEEKSVALQNSNEQILLQKQQLEQSNSEKDKLMSILTHDLRTPLINVQNYLELLNENSISSVERPMLEKALLRSTNNAVEMLSGLLHWSRSQMEGPNVQLQEISLTEVLLRTLEIEKLHAARKNIILNYDLPANLMVYADVDMLQLVVRNLVSNAIKFTQTEGLITITAWQQVDQCILMVQDNGQGISADKQKVLFSLSTEPSYGTNNERGVGLGLVLCKEYIERQGGTISFESEAGKGSAFFVSIPCHITS